MNPFQGTERNPMHITESFRDDVEKVVGHTTSFPAQINDRMWVTLDSDTNELIIEAEIVINGTPYYVGPKQQEVS